MIKNSIILNDAYIGDNTHVENCIVESHGTLRANTFYSGDDAVRIVAEKTTKDICSRERLEGGYICRLQTLESARWKKKAR